MFNSIWGLLIFSINSIFPWFMAALYWKKFKNSDPAPDLIDTMQIEELRELYNTIDIVYIQKHVYTESKHQLFMEKYGILLDELDT